MQPAWVCSKATAGQGMCILPMPCACALMSSERPLFVDILCQGSVHHPHHAVACIQRTVKVRAFKAGQVVAPSLCPCEHSRKELRRAPGVAQHNAVEHGIRPANVPRWQNRVHSMGSVNSSRQITCETSPKSSGLPSHSAPVPCKTGRKLGHKSSACIPSLSGLWTFPFAWAKHPCTCAQPQRLVAPDHCDVLRVPLHHQPVPRLRLRSEVFKVFLRFRVFRSRSVDQLTEFTRSTTMHGLRMQAPSLSCCQGKEKYGDGGQGAPVPVPA